MSKKGEGRGSRGFKVKIGSLEIEEFEVLPLLITILGIILIAYGLSIGITKVPANVTAG